MIPKFEQILVPNFNAVPSGGKDFSEWLKEPEQVATLKALKEAHMNDWVAQCKREDEELMKLLVEDEHRETKTDSN